MKLETLVKSKTALETFSKCSLPIDIAWDLKLFVKEINPELSSFSEINHQTIVELGENEIIEGKETGNIKVTPENMNKYRDTMNKILDKEVDVKVPIIKIADLLAYKDNDGNKISISRNDLELLDWLIV